MKITMTGFAKQQIRETAKYIYTEFGKNSKDAFILKLNQTRIIMIPKKPKIKWLSLIIQSITPTEMINKSIMLKNSKLLVFCFI